MANGDTTTPPARGPNVLPLGPALLLRGMVIPSFAQFAMTGEDNIRIITIGALAGATCNVQGRFLDAQQGQTVPFSFEVPFSSNRMATQQDFALGTGYLLNLTCFASGAVPLIGQAFVIVQIIRGLGGATFLVGCLLAGYVTTTQTLGWPGSPIVDSIDTGGYYRTILGTLPGAGQEVKETCPTGARWDVVAVNLTLQPVIDHNPRFTVLGFSTGATFAFASQARSTFPANNPLQYLFSQAPLLIDNAFNGETLINAPICTPSTLLGGDFFVTNTQGLIAGDQYLAPTYLVREWIEAN